MYLFMQTDDFKFALNYFAHIFENWNEKLEIINKIIVYALIGFFNLKNVLIQNFLLAITKLFVYIIIWLIIGEKAISQKFMHIFFV